MIIKKIQKFLILFFMFLFPLNILSCNMSVNYKIPFLNYVDFIDQDSKDIINKNFDYKEFNDLPELEQSLRRGKTIGGVGSDYFNAKMAKMGNLKKINFSKVFKINYANINELEEKLKNIYSPTAWEQMKFFDDYLKNTDIDNDNKPDKLWEFMIPYFIQRKVVAFNINKEDINWTNQEKLDLLDPSKISNIFLDFSYEGILKTLKKKGHKFLVINDYMRDNLMIGSEDTGNFTGELNEKNYKDHTKGFKNIIKKGFGYKMNNSNINFDKSGVSTLTYLLDKKQKWDSAFLYNGDALDGYFGADNDVDDIEDKEDIRIVVPENSIFLLDGLIISRFSSSEIENVFYETIYESLFEGIEKEILNEEDNLFTNFEYVNYTSPYQKLISFVKDEENEHWILYEEKEKDNLVKDEYAEYILDIPNTAKKENIIFPIDDKLQSLINSHYIEQIFL